MVADMAELDWCLSKIVRRGLTRVSVAFVICDLIKHTRFDIYMCVTAFGGYKVTNLLQVIERNHRRFKKPPIGPIGSHVALIQGDKWAVAVENAIGKLLNAFIVTDHKDSLVLRSCAREANYPYLQIIIYDFSIPRYVA
ncbi:putative structural maintenance of chromosomes protein [Helianthus annuus]|nr:putative structural maintenance of chromosomes protein [Helianthus annuus]